MFSKPKLGKRVVSIAVLVTAGALSLAACGTQEAAPRQESAPVEQAATELSFLTGTAKANNAQPKTGDWATGSDGTPNTADQNVARKWVQLKASKAGDLDPVVVNGAGLTLYRFDKDTAKPSKSTCNGDCAKTWPPVLVTPGSKVFLAGIKKSAVGTVKRDDGTLQLTVGGWPAYRFAKDTKPGDTLGQGVGGTWFGLAPNGQKAQGGQPEESTSPQKPASSAILFDGKNFSDDEPSQGLAGKGCQNVARPDVTSSVSASGSLKLWSEKDCEGKSLVIDGDVKDLAKLGFDDTVSSVFFG
ncbi:lipoprotein [Amycolatopsis azurea]|uniref:Putative lipoprotein n=1 Tax=Amycolatopsis azurea DSM 43854 TaxID=1238180 RepID=M2PT86_9PSEU|nr:lipoprotein [Amycolatopsis azurea]EMD22745.1 putative lipoprotein [Amycolatopsis azurea DSM 43854]OOC00847.1 hypothetical protein B0293_40900 [Amycolatopsis azurea DSM 43854]